MLYKTGNVVINKQTGKISTKVNNNLYKAIGVADLRVDSISDIKIEEEKFLGDTLLSILYV